MPDLLLYILYAFGGLIGTFITFILLIKIGICICPDKTRAFTMNLSFIPWAIAGGQMPPYFDNECWGEDVVDDWLRDGDVVCCTAAKSGTGWLLNCVHQIRTLGDPENKYTSNTHDTPWPEFVRHPGETLEERIDDMLEYPGCTDYSIRAFKSHAKPLNSAISFKQACLADQVIPIRDKPNTKFIACMRAGEDVTASFYPFFPAHEESFRKAWGGFPPLFKDFGECFDFITKDQPNFWFGYATSWWPHRHEPNVLMLHYADLKRDLPGNLKKIASFIGVDVPASAWPRIVEKCGINWMKQNEHIFYYQIPKYGGKGGLPKTVMRQEKGTYIRKGAVGEGETLWDQLTDAQRQRWVDMQEEHFGKFPGLQEWLKNGGPLPSDEGNELSDRAPLLAS